MRLSFLTRFFWVASAIIYGLGLLHFCLVFLVGLPESPLRPLNLDGETTLPAWYSTVLLFASGLVALLIGLADQRPSRTRSFWMLLAVLLVYMSADESAALHEGSAKIAGMLGVPEDAMGGPVFRWLLFGVPAVLVIGLIFLPKLRLIDRRTATRFVLAGVIYVFGAVVMEFVGIVPWSAPEGPYILARLLVTVEEGFEILGLTFLITTLLTHLVHDYPVLVLRLHKGLSE